MQHAFREQRQLAFAGAVLPAVIDELLNDEVLTFMRRADRHHVGAVADAAVREAISQPIATHGKSTTSDALDAMVEATEGYPFFIQLVGDQVWRKVGAANEITCEMAQDGIDAARRRLGQLVHAPALAEASDVNKSFLLAMAQDDGPSLLGDIAKRLSVNSNYASQYRLRLIALELIPQRAWPRPVAYETSSSSSPLGVNESPGSSELEKSEWYVVVVVSLRTRDILTKCLPE